MEKSVLTPSFLSITILLLLIPDTSLADPRAHVVNRICGTGFANNATVFVQNFIAIMETISSQMRTSGFGVSVIGSGRDTLHVMSQCYGDLSLVDCILCYAEARNIFPQCFPTDSGIIVLDGCFMRLNNYSFLQEYTGPNDRTICGNTTQRGSDFQASARQALSLAVSSAPGNNGYARAEVAVSRMRNDSVYVLANCWRTINASSCRACLENAYASLSGCLPWSEGRAMNMGCFMRYSDADFLNPIPSNGSSRERIIVIVVSVVSAVAVLIIAIVIGFYSWKRRMIQKKRKGDAEILVNTLHDSKLNFKYSTLEKATGSFDESNKLGQGGNGTIYKGVLSDGREIAVKRLFYNNRHRAADFYNEVNIISSVAHQNLVKLLGCSCSGPESLLVYEFLPNLSLDRYIFDTSTDKILNWKKRFEIIIGITEGLVYLHENTKARIIHRDIKASNILLDFRLRAKIADFGLAKSFQENQSHISTAIAGTLGYMAPEYLALGQLSEKADVYSFGVLLLEIVTGRQNNRSKTAEYTESLVVIAWKHFQQRTVEELFDPNLMMQNYNHMSFKNEVLRVVHVGLLCTQESPSLRPSMSKALQMMVNQQEHLPAPTSPPFMDDKTMELNGRRISPSMPIQYSNDTSSADISQSIFYPR